MIPENRLDEIALLPSRRENLEHNDVEANYLVGRDMAGAIHELLEERHETLLQVSELQKQVADPHAALVTCEAKFKALAEERDNTLRLYSELQENRDILIDTMRGILLGLNQVPSDSPLGKIAVDLAGIVTHGLKKAGIVSDTPLKRVVPVPRGVACDCTPADLLEIGCNFSLDTVECQKCKTFWDVPCLHG